MKQNPLFVWELLELVLLHLDTRTLLISQRVCWLWNKVIKSSKAIQQALFLLPVEPTDVPHHERVRNPLLDEIVWPHVMQHKPDYPIFKGIFANVPVIKRSFRRKSASWRKMLIQQPPTSVLGVVELVTHQNRKKKETHHEQILVRPHGAYLTLGAVYDAVNKDFMQPCRETWVLSSEGPQDYLDEFLKDDRAPILDVTLKECDIVVVIYAAAVLIRGCDVKKKTELELWLDELLVNSPKYKPRRSGGVYSEYYGRGYSRMAVKDSHMVKPPNLAVRDFKSQYLFSTFGIRELPMNDEEWIQDWALPEEEKVPKPPMLDGVLQDHELAIGESDLNEQTNRSKLRAILLHTFEEDKKRNNNLPFVRKSLSSPRPSGDMMRSPYVQFKRKIEMPVTYDQQRRNLTGIMDYSFWYGDQENLEINVIMVEAPYGETSKARQQLLVYMAMIHAARRKSHRDCAIDGVASDGHEFHFVSIKSNFTWTWYSLTWLSESSKILIVSHLTRMFRRAAMLSATSSLSTRSVSKSQTPNTD